MGCPIKNSFNNLDLNSVMGNDIFCSEIGSEIWYLENQNKSPN